ncbi:MAG: NADH:flavin oxidoreductase [Myxococcales bacterium]|nr:NADH:flavin oxidoreductase [Myxococcales bacterium]
MSAISESLRERRPSPGRKREIFAEAQLGSVTLRNRIIKAATFEGMTSEHVVSDALIDFHTRMARGGVGMTTIAYCAVSPEGCGAPNEMILGRDAIPGLQRIADAVHAEGAAISAQIGHAGAVASTTGARGRSPSRIFSPLAMRRTNPLDRGDIERITREFADAARVALEGGLDAIELHLGHGYLLSEFLSPGLNRRDDEYGGSLENRARFPRAVVRGVRDAVGTRLAVIAKLNMDDGVPGGLWVEESVRFARMLESDGALDAIELTGGSSLQNPMYLFRGEAPLREMAESMPSAVKWGLRLFGRFFFRTYPFEEAYFLPYARQFREALSMPLILLGGINDLETLELAMEEGFEFAAMGRALLREPDLPLRYQNGSATRSLCIHCNKCIPTIYQGTHCVLTETQ